MKNVLTTNGSFVARFVAYAVEMCARYRRVAIGALVLVAMATSVETVRAEWDETDREYLQAIYLQGFLNGSTPEAPQGYETSDTFTELTSTQGELKAIRLRCDELVRLGWIIFGFMVTNSCLQRIHL